MQKFQGKISLGDWVAGLANATTYLAATDGIVCAYETGGGADIRGKTDAATPPITVRVHGNSTAAGVADAITFPVKRGDYWRVDAAAAVVIFWIPLR